MGFIAPKRRGGAGRQGRRPVFVLCDDCPDPATLAEFLCEPAPSGPRCQRCGGCGIVCGVCGAAPLRWTANLELVGGCEHDGADVPLWRAVPKASLSDR
jgi:hypothetical protein